MISTPATYFIYPSMGMHLERKATYINVNREDVRVATAYPLCEPRTNPDPEAWLANLRKAGVRWLLVNRHPALDFPAGAGLGTAATRSFRAAVQRADERDL